MLLRANIGKASLIANVQIFNFITGHIDKSLYAL